MVYDCNQLQLCQESLDWSATFRDADRCLGGEGHPKGASLPVHRASAKPKLAHLTRIARVVVLQSTDNFKTNDASGTTFEMNDERSARLTKTSVIFIRAAFGDIRLA